MTDGALDEALAILKTPGVLLGYRTIGANDAAALLPEEPVPGAPESRRASGAARIVARGLLARLGLPGIPIRKGAGGAPLWPEGISGSLAHDNTFALAAVGRVKDIGSIGIDIEPAAPLPADMLDLVFTPNERARLGHDPLAGTLHFAIKEAVYKAVYPLDRVFLEFHDISVGPDAGKAVTRTGRVVRVKHAVASHIVALAMA